MDDSEAALRVYSLPYRNWTAHQKNLPTYLGGNAGCELVSRHIISQRMLPQYVGYVIAQLHVRNGWMGHV